MHLLGMMLERGPIRLCEEWSGPAEIQIVLVGVDAVCVREIFTEHPCQDLVRALFLDLHREDPVINHAGV